MIRARLIFHKETGARIEVFCLEPYDPADYERAFSVKGEAQWKCIVGNLKKWKEGPLHIDFETDGVSCRLSAEKVEATGKEQIIRFSWNADMTFGQLLDALGRIPIPPYLRRESEESDNSRYQTVYSRYEGSVAAPTAGLHFTPEIFEAVATRRASFRRGDAACRGRDVSAGQDRPGDRTPHAHGTLRNQAFGVEGPDPARWKRDGRGNHFGPDAGVVAGIGVPDPAAWNTRCRNACRTVGDLRCARDAGDDAAVGCTCRMDGGAEYGPHPDSDPDHDHARIPVPDRDLVDYQFSPTER